MRVYVNGRNLGFNRNFHTACLRATADLVAISDQDDLWLPHKIEWQVRAIGACNVCFSAHLRGRDMATAHTVTPQLLFKSHHHLFPIHHIHARIQAARGGSHALSGHVVHGGRSGGRGRRGTDARGRVGGRAVHIEGV